MKRAVISGMIQTLEGADLTPPLTVKQVLLSLIGTSRVKEPEEAVRLMVLGQRIANTDESFDFNAAEEALLRRVFNENPPGYFAVVIAQAYQIIDEANKVPEDKK